MPRIGITAYDLLVSCPGDVAEYVDIIRECVEIFNRTIGIANNLEIVVKHWSMDSYPQSGDKPQELLNKQFIRDCDAAVALFWTKFGTPTDKYGSGTEEEIEEMLSSGKQVFMYFFDLPTNPSTLDMEQYNKILEFRRKYESRGIYYRVNDKNSFKTQFTNHLTMHFLPLVSGEKKLFEKKFAPKIVIQDEGLGDTHQAVFMTSHFMECQFLNTKKEKCIKTLKSLQNSILPLKPANESMQNENNSIQKKDIISLKSLPAINLSNLQKAEISDKVKKVILDFSLQNSITIEPDFWNVGNLKMAISPLPTQFGGGTSFVGRNEEEQRYKSIEDLYWCIKEYLEYKEFFSIIDEQYHVNLVVSNYGNTFDEDIDVKLIIDHGLIVHPKDIKIPGINIIEEVLKIGFIEFAYKIPNDDTINPYPDYSPVTHHLPNPYPTLLGKSINEEYEEHQEQYEDRLNRIFCYQYFFKEDKDIVLFHINYLKHNTTISFPSVLVFKNVPKEIEYIITSKHMPDVIKGKMEILTE